MTTSAPSRREIGDLVNETADAISAIADGLRAVEGIETFCLERRAAKAPA
jgi:hypothetical protein